MKLLIWDFDGTLGYQKRGYFSESIVRVIRETEPGDDDHCRANPALPA